MHFKIWNIIGINDKIVKTFGGSIGKAILQKNDQENYSKIDQLIHLAAKSDLTDFLNFSKFIYDKENIYKLLDYMIIYMYEEGKKEKRYINCIDKVNKCQERLRKNCNFDMCLDSMLIKIWEEFA